MTEFVAHWPPASIFLKTAAIRGFMKRFQRNSGVKLLSASPFEWRGLFLAFLIVCLFVWTQQQIFNNWLVSWVMSASRMLINLSKWLNRKRKSADFWPDVSWFLPEVSGFSKFLKLHLIILPQTWWKPLNRKRTVIFLTGCDKNSPESSSFF